MIVRVALFLLVVNHTEEWRMYRRLKRGDYGIQSSPEYFKEEFCGFRKDRETIEALFDSNCTFVGLIGVKATGKSSTLKYEASKFQERSIFVPLDFNKSMSLTDALLAHMREQIWMLPDPLRQFRLSEVPSNRELVRRVFRQAEGRVRVFVDIHEVSRFELGLPHQIEQSLPEDAYQACVKLMKQSRAKSFVQEVKNLVQDAKLIQCMFASENGYLFEEEERHEGRCSLFRSTELSLSATKAYLLEKYGYQCENELLLQHIPRLFPILQSFAMATDKQVFAQDCLKQEMHIIQSSIDSFPTQSYTSWIIATPAQRIVFLYRKALQDDIGIDEIFHVAGLTMEQFIDTFVITEIFRPTESGKYTLHCDATREAVKRVIN